MKRDRRDDATVSAFNSDVGRNAGYLYTTDARLSSRLANARLTEAALQLSDLRGRSVIDVGCGDGTYTVDLRHRGGASYVHGIDPASAAIRIARERHGGPGLSYSVASAYALPFEDASFDVAHLRGVLHHMDDPVRGLAEALRVSREVLLVEPNGYNPVLKVIEKVSPYHRAHNEKSYAPHLIDRWLEELGAKREARQWCGLVPFFCPDQVARVLKLIEPVVERLPLVSQLGCAVYVCVAKAR